MKNIWKFIVSLFLALSFLQARGQETDSLVAGLMRHYYAINNFYQFLPQEKIYLHLDNTSYYEKDPIWFKAYIVATGSNRPSNLSKTLYVELLNPGGEVIERQTLKIVDGGCHGNFTLNRLPFYPGFYEVRAYTKYMLNFDPENIYSRSLPVFSTPQREGDYQEKEIRKYGNGNYPMLRAKLKKEKRVNLRFFPEGGNLVQGVTSQVAFEATDAYGNPIKVTGNILNEKKEEVGRLTATHDGRGVFAYTPTGAKSKASIDYDGKKYLFDLPTAQPQGYVMTVDNLTDLDSLNVSICKNADTPSGIVGMAFFSGGRVNQLCLVEIDEEPNMKLRLDKKRLAPGVSRLALFDTQGRLLSDRLLFISPNRRLNIEVQTAKENYDPYEKVNIELNLRKGEEPIRVPVSVSIRDGENEVDPSGNALTDLLLMSEIKGYVRRPSYYFESEEITHRTALDHLLMVQGWRRYSWEQMTGAKPFELKYNPEQGIDIQGRVISFVREKPQPDTEISSFLYQKSDNEEEEAKRQIVLFKTDSLGCFSFVADVEGECDLILAASRDGKKKDYRIILDRAFSPSPRKYQVAELQFSIKGESVGKSPEPDLSDVEEEESEAFFKAYEDSLTRKGDREKIHQLKGVTVTAKKNSKEKDIFRSRSESLANYDVPREIDRIQDSGEFIGSDLHNFLLKMNPKFYPGVNRETLRYKGKAPLFVINYERTRHNEIDYFWYKTIRIEAIKAIYITEDVRTIHQYADPKLSMMDVMELYSCGIMIETFPEGHIPVKGGKGVRKTKLTGYSPTKEFYHPDYSVLPHDPDYRRTLYWNPSLLPDEKGKALIEFYNNSRCRKFTIHAETVTPQGEIGVYGK